MGERIYKEKTIKYGGNTYTYSTRSGAIDVYNKLRAEYNPKIEDYGRGRNKLAPAGEKTFGYLDKQNRMMASRMKTGVYERTAGQFKNAFVQALNSQLEYYDGGDVEDVEKLVGILNNMHHATFKQFYNSLSVIDRKVLFDTENYYSGTLSSAVEFAQETLNRLYEFAQYNPKLQEIIDDIEEDY